MSNYRPTINRRRFLAQAAPAAASVALLRAQNVATVFGNIRLRNGRPGTGLTVAIGPRFNYTDVDGFYRILNVPYGQYQMEIRRGNQTLKRVPIRVSEPRVRHDETV